MHSHRNNQYEEQLGKLLSYKVLPVSGFQLCPEKSVAEIESDALPCRRFVRDLWQTENHPGVDLSKTELSHQTESVHWPV